MNRPRTVSDEDILETTADLLLERGGDISIDRIGKEVGLSGPGLLKRFGSKTKLIALALMPRGLKDTPIEAASRGPDDRPFRDQMKEMAELGAQIFSFLVPRLAVMRALRLNPQDVFKALQPDLPPPPLRAQQELTGWFERCNEKGLIREVPFDSLAAMFLGSLQGPAFASHVFGANPLDRSLSEHAHVVADLIADMVEVVPGASQHSDSPPSSRTTARKPVQEAK